jgi:hypothetical protein
MESTSSYSSVNAGFLYGDTAAGLPVARPARIAKVLGLEVPPMLLARADKVTE